MYVHRFCHWKALGNCPTVAYSQTAGVLIYFAALVSLICFPNIIYPPPWRYVANIGVWDLAMLAKKTTNLWVNRFTLSFPYVSMLQQPYHVFVHCPYAKTVLHSVCSSPGWAIHISWSKCCLCVCVCVSVCLAVWMLTTVAQIVTAAHRDLQSCMHRPTNEPCTCTPKTRSVWPTLRVTIAADKKVGVNRYFQSQWKSQSMRYLLMWHCALLMSSPFFVNGYEDTKWSFICWCVVKKLPTHSLRDSMYAFMLKCCTVLCHHHQAYAVL